jgi:RNA polymerase sigma-70 factor (ECF subfamily)
MFDWTGSDARTQVGRLYDVHGASLYRYALMLLSDSDAAEDTVQQVFVATLARADRIRDEVNYLRRAVRNECFSVLRRRRSSGEAVDVALLEKVAEPTKGDHLERIALEDAIRQLPPEQREAIHLHVFEGFTLREIAEFLDLSINTVATRYRYAISKLKRILTVV